PKVCHRYGFWRPPDSEGLLILEGAIAVTEQHANRIVASVGNDEVRLAVPVDVRHRYRGRIFSGGEVATGLEGAVTVAQQYAHVFAVHVSGGEVGLAVAV